MTGYRAGMTLRLTNDGRPVTVWSPAHLPGTYWCHLGEGEARKVVLVRVRNLRTMPLPEVALVEEK